MPCSQPRQFSVALKRQVNLSGRQKRALWNSKTTWNYTQTTTHPTHSATRTAFYTLYYYSLPSTVCQRLSKWSFNHNFLSSYPHSNQRLCTKQFSNVHYKNIFQFDLHFSCNKCAKRILREHRNYAANSNLSANTFNSIAFVSTYNSFSLTESEISTPFTLPNGFIKPTNRTISIKNFLRNANHLDKLGKFEIDTTKVYSV